VYSVRERLKSIVDRAIGGRVELRDKAYALVLEIDRRVEEKEEVDVVSLRDFVLETGLDEEVVQNLFTEIGSYPEYDKYRVLLSDFENFFVENTFTAYERSEYVFNLGDSKSRLLRKNRTNVGRLVRSRLKGSFIASLDARIREKYTTISGASVDINSITSDSKTEIELISIDETYLSATFSGQGKQLYQDIKSIYDFALEFGGYDGSLTGGLRYQAEFYEYLVAMAYGKRLPYGVLTDQFGKFKTNTENTIIEDLSFLEVLFLTRSANQNTVSCNPVAVKFSEGVEDRFIGNGTNAPDSIPLILESLYVQFLKLGDVIYPLRNENYEELGHTELFFDQLAEVFPSSKDVREGSKDGLTGAVEELIKSYNSLKALLGEKPDLAYIAPELSRFSVILANFSDSLVDGGFKPGGFVASLELTKYEPNRDALIQRLLDLGFNRVEVQDILSFEDFSGLLEKYAPFTDSQDVISFFKAYDLTKLIYEFGGREAITQYINFLYGKDSGQSLLRMLQLLDVNRTQSSKVIQSEYSKLVGYLIPLTYAIDPEQLDILNRILVNNNLDLLESISFLVEQGVSTILKRKEDIELLDGTVAQMILTGGPEYEEQKPLWNKLISESAGNAKGLEGLYNRVNNITAGELYDTLGKPSATSPIGKMLEGLKGGRLTSLLRYCNLFGLLYTLSPYPVSGQLINLPADKYTGILELVDNLKVLSERLRLSSLLLSSSPAPSGVSVYSDPLIQAQNKEFGALVAVLTGEEGGSYDIVESPGIGNSRIPNGVRMSNSLTPEEAALVAGVGVEIGAFTQNGRDTESATYVKISASNILASGVTLEGPEESTTSNVEVGDNPIPDYSVTYTPSLGGGSGSSTFDPVASCAKFGGSGCENKGYTPDKMCSKGFNKSLFPEEGYGQTPFNPGAVGIDRPLGSYMIPKVTYTAIPSTNSQYTFSSHGLSEISRSPVFKDSEFLCASLKDPYEYGACMSLLKCKKFNPPYEGKYWFEFCPSTLHGGRLRK
jgi:hypothetical protein